MDRAKNMGIKDIKELLVKCWMTHDAMWFFHTLRNDGIEKANQINKAAIESLAEIEVSRVRKKIGNDSKEIKTFEHVVDMIDTMFGVVKADFMDFQFSFPEKNVFHWEVDKCFAYEGMKNLGVSENYECGLLHRVQCWLNVLGVDYRSDPEVKGCLLNEKDHCSGNIRFNFEE